MMIELDYEEIGYRIKQRRLSQHITQEKLADDLSVNPSHISNIECGRAHPSLTALVAIANSLKCSVDLFLSQEYTYKVDDKDPISTIDKKLQKKLKFCSENKKEKLLKILDIL